MTSDTLRLKMEAFLFSAAMTAVVVAVGVLLHVSWVYWAIMIFSAYYRDIRKIQSHD